MFIRQKFVFSVCYCSLLTEVRTLHDSFAESPLATNVETGLTGNPLHAFHLIKRFATTWRVIWATASNFTAYEGKNSFECINFKDFIDDSKISFA